MDSLHQKLEGRGLQNISYMVVNHQGEQSQRLHPMLAQRLSANITLYQQDAQQDDVWQALKGDKDDFLVYDRCSRLTNHLSLPYTIIGQGHIEKAIRQAYCNSTCGDCAHDPADIPEECTRAAQPMPEGGGGGREGEGGRDHGRGHHAHGHGHHHGGHHHGVGHGHHHGHEGRETSGRHVGQQGHQQQPEQQQQQHGGAEQMDLVHGQQQVGQQAMHMGHQ